MMCSACMQLRSVLAAPLPVVILSHVGRMCMRAKSTCSVGRQLAQAQEML